MKDIKYLPPEPAQIVEMRDPEVSEALLREFPELADIYDLRKALVQEMESDYLHEQDFYYEDSQVPSHVVGMIAWRVLSKFQQAISEKVLLPRTCGD